MSDKYCIECGNKLHFNCKNNICKCCLAKCIKCGANTSGRGKTRLCKTCVCKSKERNEKISKKRKLRVGWKHSEETKIKMSKNSYTKKYGHSEETKKKISKSNIGNAGPWLNKKLPDYMKEKISKTRKEKGIAKGKNNPFFGLSLSGNLNGMYGKSVLDIWIEKYGEVKAKKMWREKYKNLGSGLSKKFKNLLDKWNYRYEEEFMLSDPMNNKKRFYDFYLSDYNLLIEVDGYHFHHKDSTFPRIKERLENDIYKNKLAKKQGFKLVRIWEDKLEEKWDII